MAGNAPGGRGSATGPRVLVGVLDLLSAPIAGCAGLGTAYGGGPCGSFTAAGMGLGALGVLSAGVFLTTGVLAIRSVRRADFRQAACAGAATGTVVGFLSLAVGVTLLTAPHLLGADDGSHTASGRVVALAGLLLGTTNAWLWAGLRADSVAPR